jgi:PAS domain S-box-containing protein
MNPTRSIQHQSFLHEALLNEILKRTGHAIVLLNTEAEILFCSQGITALTGFETQELLGKTVFHFFHPADLPAARQQHQFLTEMNANASVSLLQVRNKQGDMIWIDVVVKNLLHVPEINALFVLIRRSSEAETEERKLVQAATEAREAEKEYLAAELHDNINQVITATKLLVDAARNGIEQEELLRLSSANLEAVAEDIRRLSYSMVSYDLRDFGLAVAVRAFIATLNKGSGILFRTELDEKALKALQTDQQLHLYRIIQEGTNNIIRHAGATMAEITLTHKEGLLYLVISDNGRGFSVNRLKPGMGLSSITARVKLLQGHFHVRAPQGTGTTIEIHFPM